MKSFSSTLTSASKSRTVADGNDDVDGVDSDLPWASLSSRFWNREGLLLFWGSGGLKEIWPSWTDKCVANEPFILICVSFLLLPLLFLFKIVLFISWSPTVLTVTAAAATTDFTISPSLCMDYMRDPTRIYCVCWGWWLGRYVKWK